MKKFLWIDLAILWSCPFGMWYFYLLDQNIKESSGWWQTPSLIASVALIIFIVLGFFREIPCKFALQSKVPNPDLNQWRGDRPSRKRFLVYGFFFLPFVFTLAGGYWLTAFAAFLWAVGLLWLRAQQERLALERYLSALHDYVAETVRKEIGCDRKSLRYGIIRMDDTGMVPSTFSRGGTHPDRMLVFDWQTEVLPWLETLDDPQERELVLSNARFLVYIVQAEKYATEELDALCGRISVQEHYHISRMCYLYVIDSGKQCSWLVEKYAWLRELEIALVDSVEEIDLEKLIDDQLSRKSNVKGFLKMKMLDRTDPKLLATAMVDDVVDPKQQPMLFWSKDFWLQRGEKFLLNYERNFYGAERKIARWAENIAVSFLFLVTAIFGDIKKFDKKGVRQLLRTMFPVNFACYDRRCFFGDYMCASLEDLDFTEKSYFYSYYNEQCSQFYRYIPRPEGQPPYPAQPANYYICGFFQNLFRGEERKVSILAGFDHADLALRFVLYSLAVRRGISPEELYGEKWDGRDEYSMDLQLLGQKILQVVDERDAIYRTVRTENVKMNVLLKNATDVIRDILSWEIEGEEIQFIKLVELIRLIRNRTRGHGAVTDTQEDALWYVVYVLLVVLGNMLQLYDFGIEIRDGEVYAGYVQDGSLAALGQYATLQKDKPCLLYNVSRSQKEYLNYWEGTFMIPEMV